MQDSPIQETTSVEVKASESITFNLNSLGKNEYEERVETLKSRVENLEEAHSDILEKYGKITPRKGRSKSNLQEYNKTLDFQKISSFNLHNNMPPKSVDNRGNYGKNEVIFDEEMEIFQRESEAKIRKERVNIESDNLLLFEENALKEENIGEEKILIEKAKNENFQLNQRNNSLSQELVLKKSEKESYDSLNQNLEREINEKENRIGELKASIEDKKLHSKNYENEVLNLTQKIQECEFETKKLENNSKFYSKLVEDMNKILLERDQEIQKMVEEVEAKEGKLENLKLVNETKKSEIDNLKLKIEAITKEFSKYEILEHKNNFEIEILQSKIENLEKESLKKSKETEISKENLEKLLGDYNKKVGKKLEIDFKNEKVKTSVLFYENKIEEIKLSYDKENELEEEFIEEKEGEVEKETKEKEKSETKAQGSSRSGKQRKDPLEEIISKFEILSFKIDEILNSKNSQNSSRKSSLGEKNLQNLDVTNNIEGHTTGNSTSFNKKFEDVLTDRLEETFNLLKNVQIELLEAKKEIQEIPNLKEEMTNFAQILSNPSSPVQEGLLLEIKKLIEERSSERRRGNSIFTSSQNSRKMFSITDFNANSIKVDDFTGIKTPKFSGDLSLDYSNMTEFIFRTNSVIINFLADVIRESKFCEKLQKILKIYMRMNVERARRYFALKSRKNEDEGGVLLKEFFDAGVEELKAIEGAFIDMNRAVGGGAVRP